MRKAAKVRSWQMSKETCNTPDRATDSAEARHDALVAIKEDLLLFEAAASTLHAVHAVQDHTIGA
jgi:hypothetical protein